jgi:HAD superfamily hydrolase (TIGR01549 family)
MKKWIQNFIKPLAGYRPVNRQTKEKKANFGAKWLPKPFALLPGIKTSIPLFEELWNLFAKGECWKLAEKAESTLNTLRERGYELAVLSNNDARLRSVLNDLKIDQAFDHLFISSEMGCEKPELEIFRKVEQTMDRKPNEILHLGDSHSRDFLGARKAGWSALLYGEPKLENEQITCFSELLNYLP